MSLAVSLMSATGTATWGPEASCATATGTRLLPLLAFCGLRVGWSREAIRWGCEEERVTWRDIEHRAGPAEGARVWCWAARHAKGGRRHRRGRVVGQEVARGFDGWDGTTRVGRREGKLPSLLCERVIEAGAHLRGRTETEPRCHLLNPSTDPLPGLDGRSVPTPVPRRCSRLMPKFAAGCVTSTAPHRLERRVPSVATV